MPVKTFGFDELLTVAFDAGSHANAKFHPA